MLSQSIIEQEKRLFSLYGYILEKEERDYLVFSLAGMYPAVEIVSLSGKNIKLNEIREEYSNLGYAVHISEDNDIHSIEDYLFNGFFRVKESNEKAARKYDAYVGNLMGFYGRPASDYKYIQVHYSCDLNFEEQKTSMTILDSINNYLQNDRSCLLIIEAAAGFGKTSTAYEIVNQFRNVVADCRPFMMELFKDRTASNFRYLLLSQIEQQFDTILKTDLVIYNIRQGRIPLIIDGFDELLSKDLDTGNTEATFSDVKTMLSTIADLLTQKTKVILTTRKTAIFSGESFFEWFCQRKDDGFDFEIVRYQLDIPRLSDWIPASKRELMKDSVWLSLSNPVLLGYLRYADDKEFKDVVSHPNVLIDRYFKMMLRREVDRQDLPLNIKEQMIILRRLAACYAGYNITSDIRSSVKDNIRELNKDILSDKVSSSDEMDSLVNALTNHALLDRKSDGNVGFINDFIFGYLLADSFIYDSDDFSTLFQKEAALNSIDKMIRAAEYCSKIKRELCWESVRERCSLSGANSFWTDVRLLHHGADKYCDLTIDGDYLRNCELGVNQDSFNRCCFTNIEFNNCLIDFSMFDLCTFINCSFYNTTFQNFDPHSSEVDFFTCKGDYPSDIDVEETGQEHVPSLLDEEKALRLEILSHYIQVGGTGRKMRLISKVKEEFLTRRKAFKKAFSSLTGEGYLLCNGDKSFLSDPGWEYYKRENL